MPARTVRKSKTAANTALKRLACDDYKLVVDFGNAEEIKPKPRKKVAKRRSPAGKKVDYLAFSQHCSAAAVISSRLRNGPRLLSGGNPQIRKGYGDIPVQQYIASMLGWKQGVVKQLDHLIISKVPAVGKAVKWNTPLYGLDEGWFIGYHAMTKYIKVTFFQGALMKPSPPEPSKSGNVRYFHIYEKDKIDNEQLGDWIVQASELPSQKL